MKSKKTTWHFLSYAIDTFFVLSLITMVISEVKGFKFHISEEAYKAMPMESFAVTITLIPCVVTVISVALGFNNDKIYGATISDINDIRGKWYFTHLHKIIVVCVLLGVHSLLFVLALKISLYCLEGISFIYAIIFSAQDISILIHSKRVVKWILKCRYLRKGKEGKLFRKNENDTFDKIVTNIMLTDGVETAFQTLKRHNIDLPNMFEYLMGLQNDFLQIALKNRSINPSQQLYLPSDVPVTDAIKHGYENVSAAISKRLDKRLDSKALQNKYIQVANSLFLLRHLCKDIGMKDEENEEIDLIITDFLISYGTKRESPIGVSTIVYMLATTLNSGELWFAERLRDNGFSTGIIFDFKTNLLGVFTSMLIYHLLTRNVLPQEKKTKIQIFLSEPNRSRNSLHTSWLECMKDSLENASSEEILKSISEMANFYDSVFDGTFDFCGDGKRLYSDTKDGFTKRDLFHNWLLMVFKSLPYSAFPNKAFEDAMNSLDEQNKKELAEELSERWLAGEELRSGIDYSFLSFCENGEINENRLFDGKSASKKMLVEKLVEFRAAHYRTEYEKNAINISEKELKDAFGMIRNEFDGALKNANFFDSKLSVENGQIHCEDYSLKGNEWKKQLQLFSAQIPSLLSLIIEYEIKEKVCGLNNIEEDEIEKLFEAIEGIDADRTSCWCWQKDYLPNIDSELKEKITSSNIKYVPHIRPLAFWRDGTIRFNAAIDMGDSFAIPYSRAEIEEIIKDHYQPCENGLYRYSEVENDEKHSFTVTRKELTEYLQKTLMHVRLTFRYNVSVDSKNVVLIDKKINWGALLSKPKN